MKSRPWTEEEVNKLRAMVASGASPVRTCAALRRSLAVTKIKAREIGTPFRTVLEER